MTTIGYECRFCGQQVDATAEDIANARAYEAEIINNVDGDIERSSDDAEAMDRFGRDICPSCAGD